MVFTFLFARQSPYTEGDLHSGPLTAPPAPGFVPEMQEGYWAEDSHLTGPDRYCNYFTERTNSDGSRAYQRMFSHCNESGSQSFGISFFVDRRQWRGGSGWLAGETLQPGRSFSGLVCLSLKTNNWSSKTPDYMPFLVFGQIFYMFNTLQIML